MAMSPISRVQNLFLPLFLLIASSLAMPQDASGQNNDLNRDHVTWDYVTPTLEGAPGETVVFRFRANLKPKVHLYTQKTYPDSVFGPSPTELSTGGSKVVKRAGGLKADKGAVSSFDPNFETETAYWKGTVTFSVPFTIAESAEPGSTEEAWVNLYYQTCDDNSCKPPLDSRFTFKVKVVNDVALDTAAVRQKAVGDIAAATSSILDQIFAAARFEGSGEGSPAIAGVDEEVDGGDGEDADGAVADEDEIDEDDPDAAVAGDGSRDEAGGVPEETMTAAGESRMTIREEIEESKKKGLLGYILLAMGFGFIALGTPCVFPMIPITISFFTKREQNSRGQAVRDASIYGLGIILTFTALGAIVAAIYGAAGVNAMATNPWVNLLIAGIFIAFALSLFGLFDIQVPSSVLNRLNAKANAGGGVTSILLMGFVFSLTSFTCTVPFVGPALASVGEGGDWFWPIIGMAAFATVFALPFFLLALFPSWLKAMPKSGGWLNAVKVTMGFVEIAAAMKFLSNADLVWDWGLLTREAVLAVWISVAVLSSLYLLGRFRLPHDTPMEKIGVMRMLFSMGFLAIGFWLLTGLFGGRLGEADAFLPPQEYPGRGNTSILASVSSGGGAGSSGGHAEEELGEGRVMAEGMEWVKDDYDLALAEAKRTGKPIFIDFTGYTCTNCRWMEVNVFTRQEVQELMKQYVLARLYTDRREESNQRNRDMQIERFKTIDLPYYVVVTPNDEVVDETVFTRDVDAFKSFLKRGLAAVEKESQDVARR